jgi:hypothetical protein
VRLVFSGVTCAVDFRQVLPIFVLVTGLHRCSSFSCSSPGSHFRVALFLVRLAERCLGSTSSRTAGCVARSLEPRLGCVASVSSRVSHAGAGVSLFLFLSVVVQVCSFDCYR